MMPTRRAFLSGTAAAIAAASNSLAQDQNRPTRSLRINIPTAPGGSPDNASRLHGEKMTGRLGQSVVV
jgi:tripartite-type tricarboxylate transporter receptor subunit TctC